MKVKLFESAEVFNAVKASLQTKLSCLVRLSLVIVIVSVVSACSSVSYYSQSVIGHSRLMLARQPIDKLIASESVDSSLREQLVLSKRLKQFAVDELRLPNTNSYKSYVALKREYPVWTVVAAPEFSLDAKQWCYPVIGCASYRGYFKRSSAEKYAQGLQAKGFETVVGGASAYSTLGWFADPLLPSMMRYGDISFAETLFHEMAHQRLYINGDSDFNEAFASLVAEVGIVRWLSQEQDSKATSPKIALINYKDSLQVQRDFYNLLNESKLDLVKLYESSQSIEAKRAKKEQIFIQLKEKHSALVNKVWGGRAWYQSWFMPELNNAKFVAISTYRERVAELSYFFDLCESDLERFYHNLSSLKAIDGRVVLPKSCL